MLKHTGIVECAGCKLPPPRLAFQPHAGGDTEREDGLLCEEDGTVTVRDSLDALLQVRARFRACMQISLSFHGQPKPPHAHGRFFHKTSESLWSDTPAVRPSWRCAISPMCVARQASQQEHLRASVMAMHTQVVLDLGRRPEARFLGVGGGEYLREAEVREQHIPCGTTHIAASKPAMAHRLLNAVLHANGGRRSHGTI